MNNSKNNLSNSDRDEIYDFIVKLDKLTTLEKCDKFTDVYYGKLVDSTTNIKIKHIIMTKYLINYLFSMKAINAIDNVYITLEELLKKEDNFIEYIYLLLYLIKISSKIYNIDKKLNLNKKNNIKPIIKQKINNLLKKVESSSTTPSSINSNLELKKALLNSASQTCNPPIGWDYYNVPSDGSCGFHAINRFLYLYKNSNFNNRNRNSKNKYNFNIRKLIINLLGKKLLNNKNININIPQINTNAIYKIKLRELFKKFSTFSENPSNNVAVKETYFMDNEMLYITSRLMNMYIFVWVRISNSHCTWLIFKPIGKDLTTTKEPDQAKLQNSIFIYNTGKHYQALWPSKGYIFKESFNINDKSYIDNSSSFIDIKFY